MEFHDTLKLRFGPKPSGHTGSACTGLRALQHVDRGRRMLVACMYASSLLVCLTLPFLAHADTLKRIKEQGVVRLAHRDSAIPFSYTDQAGKARGFSVDLCNHLVGALQEKLKLQQLNVKWIQVTTVERMQVVADDKVDMECGSTTNNPERRFKHGFSMPIYLAGIKILSPKAISAHTTDDLNGKRVTAGAGTTAAKLLIARNNNHAAGIEIVEVSGHVEAWKKLEAGEVEGWLTDDVILASYRAIAPNPAAFFLSPKFLTVEPYGIVLRKEDTALQALLNQEIMRMMRSGDYKALYEKWFMQPIQGRQGNSFNLQLPMNEIMRSLVRNPSTQLPQNF